MSPFESLVVMYNANSKKMLLFFLVNNPLSYLTVLTHGLQNLFANTIEAISAGDLFNQKTNYEAITNELVGYNAMMTDSNVNSVA